MGMKCIYRLKKEDFAHVAQKLNVALESRLDDMRKALSEYYSETENDSQHAKRGPQERDKPRQENGSADPETKAVGLCKGR